MALAARPTGAGPMPGHHAPRQPGEILGPVAGRHQHRHDDRAQGAGAQAPAQPEGQAEQHQALAKTQRQGKAQAGHHQQDPRQAIEHAAPRASARCPDAITAINVLSIAMEITLPA